MHRVLTFYKFQPVAALEEMRDSLKSIGRQLHIKGTVLLAQEGVNGTVTGDQAALEQFQQHLLQHFAEMPFKWSDLDPQNPGFHRFKVRIKNEIVSFGIPDIDVAQTGEHVSSERWNELLDDPNVLVIDTRNDYEIEIGTFPGAISPATRNFRQFPSWVAENLDPNRQQQVAMCCTGGIRCEKASAYLRSAGFKQVYQLGGGILRYLETVEPDANRWHGECFVFDQRVSVNAQLEQGDYQQCFSCRFPLSSEDLQSPHYEPGVSCPHCHTNQHTTDPERLRGLRERHRQVQLAQQRGTQHIGLPQQD
jgi:UPF0176 protein